MNDAFRLHDVKCLFEFQHWLSVLIGRAGGLADGIAGPPLLTEHIPTSSVRQHPLVNTLLPLPSRELKPA